MVFYRTGGGHAIYYVVCEMGKPKKNKNLIRGAH